MSFATHFEANRRLRKRAATMLADRIRQPKPEDLLTERGRKAFIAQARAEGLKVLAEALKEAERQGRTHAAEVLKEWESRS